MLPASVISKSAECEGKDWTVYRKADVQRIAKDENKVLITYKEGVYDLTEFAKRHPGGAEKLMMAKGGPIDTWWEMYPFHKEKAVYSLLEQYRVGTLHPDDVVSMKDLPDFKDLHTQDLGRSPELRTLQEFPYCAETPTAYL